MAKDKDSSGKDSAPTPDDRTHPAFVLAISRLFMDFYRQSWQEYQQGLLSGQDSDYHRQQMLFAAGMHLGYRAEIEQDPLLQFVADYIKSTTKLFPQPLAQMDIIAEADAYCIVANDGLIKDRKATVTACELLGLKADAFKKRREKVRPNGRIEAWRQTLLHLPPEDRTRSARAWLEDACRRHLSVRGG
jgi:hypothetical protein